MEVSYGVGKLKVNNILPYLPGQPLLVLSLNELLPSLSKLFIAVFMSLTQRLVSEASLSINVFCWLTTLSLPSVG